MSLKCSFFFLCFCWMACSDARRPNTPIKPANKSSQKESTTPPYRGTLVSSFYFSSNHLNMSAMRVEPQEGTSDAKLSQQTPLRLEMTEDSKNPELTHVQLEIISKSKLSFDLDPISETPQKINVALPDSQLQFVFVRHPKEEKNYLFIRSIMVTLPNIDTVKTYFTSTMLPFEKKNHAFDFQSASSMITLPQKPFDEFDIEDEMKLFKDTKEYAIPKYNSP